ncbi:VOC family protein [Arenibacter latericius]|uniref:VOC family protein n=1 Tax=Arenibacter latericius TaxID=86104 RepID=UPI0004098BFA|nr:VOC family protein [Arenibacter latericius]MDX1364188.1 VOC family protein [Arenibacter latericius]
MASKNPVVWFEIYVSEMERAQAFYEAVLGIQCSKLPMPDEIQGNMMMAAFPMNMNGPGASGALVKMDGFNAGGNSTIVYFHCDDCAVEESRVEKAGGKVFETKHSIGEYGFISLAYDTEGNMFGLHSML